MKNSVTLEQLRTHIDRLDERLLMLLNTRGRLALCVGRIKKRQGKRLFDPARERIVLRQLLAANPGPLSTRAVRAIYREILTQVRRLEQSA